MVQFSFLIIPLNPFLAFLESKVLTLVSHYLETKSVELWISANSDSLTHSLFFGAGTLEYDEVGPISFFWIW